MTDAIPSRAAIYAHCLGDDKEHLTIDREHALCGRIVYWIGGIAKPTPCADCLGRSEDTP